MQPLMPVVAVLVVLALLVPPVLLFATALNMRMCSRASSNSPFVVLLTSAGLIAVLCNTVFILLRLGEILTAGLKPDAFLMLAILTSWFSFFARIALKSAERYKRLLQLRRLRSYRGKMEDA